MLLSIFLVPCALAFAFGPPQHYAFYQCWQEDPTTRRWLQQLLHNVGVNRVPTLQAGAAFDHMLVS